MDNFNYTIKNGSGEYSKLDKEYKNFVKKATENLNHSDELNRWDVYNLIMDELIRLKLDVTFDEVKYRLTDGENPNKIMLDVVTRDEFQTELAWFLKSRVEGYIEEDFYNSFY